MLAAGVLAVSFGAAMAEDCKIVRQISGVLTKPCEQDSGLSELWKIKAEVDARARLRSLPGTCSVVVNGRTYMQGECEISGNPKETISASRKSDSRHFDIHEESPGIWRGRLLFRGGDADIPPTSAWRGALEKMRRSGDCWTNQRRDVVCLLPSAG